VLNDIMAAFTGDGRHPKAEPKWRGQQRRRFEFQGGHGVQDKKKLSSNSNSFVDDALMIL
jgi:hypothetical protein